jgi:hypothetical protein
MGVAGMFCSAMLVVAASPPAQASTTGCVKTPYTLTHKTDPNRKLGLTADLCIYGSDNGTLYGDHTEEINNGSSDNYIKSTYRLELHSCSNGDLLTAKDGQAESGSAHFLDAYTNRVKSDTYPKVYVRVWVTSTYAVSYGNEWVGGGLFQSTWGVTCT